MRRVARTSLPGPFHLRAGQRRQVRANYPRSRHLPRDRHRDLGCLGTPAHLRHAQNSRTVDTRAGERARRTLSQSRGVGRQQGRDAECPEGRAAAVPGELRSERRGQDTRGARAQLLGRDGFHRRARGQPRRLGDHRALPRLEHDDRELQSQRRGRCIAQLDYVRLAVDDGIKLLRLSELAEVFGYFIRREKAMTRPGATRKHKVAFLAEASTFGYGVCNPWTQMNAAGRQAHQQVLPRRADAVLSGRRRRHPQWHRSAARAPADQRADRREGRAGRANT